MTTSAEQLYEAVPVPDVSRLITEDDTPVDSLFSEKQMRLLTEPLYTGWAPPGGGPFLLAANVGVFPTAEAEPLVPDVFLSLDTALKQPLSEKRNRSYFVWEHGKPPDVVIEIVSNKEGGELARRLRGYERMRVDHYVVFDPWHQLGEATLTRFEYHAGALVEGQGPFFLAQAGLGLTLWAGVYEDAEATWLRWCDKNGDVIPTGRERAEAEKQRAEAEAQRAEAEKQRAEVEKQRAEVEKQRADAEKQRAEQLAAKLRKLGIDPEG